MATENNFNQYASFKEKKLKLASLLKASSTVLSDLAMAQFAEKLIQLEGKVNNDSFKIQIVGTFSNGKSTFINALLGEEILPTRSLPCTAVINEVKYGEEKKAVVHFRKTLPEKLISTIPAATMAHMQKHGMKNVPPLEIAYDKIDEYVVIPVDGDPEEIMYSSPYEAVELYYPSPLLKEGVEIIDSPGLNETSEHTAITLSYLDKADAIIFLLDAIKLCSADEMMNIQMLTERGFEDMFFVVNRFDMIRKNERDGIRRYAQNKLSGLSHNDIYFLSALQAVEAREDDDEELYERSGMGPFVSRLTEFLTKDKGRIKLAQPAKELRNILTNEALFRAIPTQRLQLSASLATLQARYDSVKPQLQALESNKAQLATQYELKVERAINSLRVAILQQFKDTANMIPTWIADFEPKNSIGIGTKSAVNAVKDEIMEHVNGSIKESFNKWSKDVFMPMVIEKAEDIFESTSRNMESLMREIDSIQSQLSGGYNPEGGNSLLRAAGVASALFGFNTTGGLLLTGDANFANVAKSMATDIGISLGVLLLGISNPILGISLAVGMVLKGIATGGKSALKNLKTRLSTIIPDSIRDNATSRADEILEKVKGEYDGLVNGTLAAIETNIDNVRTQVEAIIQAKATGQAQVDTRKALLDSSEKKLQDICNDLNDLVFQLVGV